MIQFEELGHKYTSIIPDDIRWQSVTSIIHKLIEPFDAPTQARKSSRNTKSKWYGVEPADILKAWDDERERSVALGSWYHRMKENELLNAGVLYQLPVYQSPFEAGIKKALPQELGDGIYPEHIVYLPSAGICGQSDKPAVFGKKLYITDYKTSKEIRREGYKNWEGDTKKMLAPVNHLDDCEFNHYALQLSIYAYIIIKHNPHLEVGQLSIEHVTFETDHLDKWGYPVHKLTPEGSPIIHDVQLIEVPYMRKEVVDILNWLKNN